MLQIKVDSRTFYLSHKTLDNYAGSKLYHMLMGKPVISNFIEKQDNHYIIDTDPDMFNILVEILRGVESLDEYEELDKQKILTLAESLDIHLPGVKLTQQSIRTDMIHPAVFNPIIIQKKTPKVLHKNSRKIDFNI